MKTPYIFNALLAALSIIPSLTFAQSHSIRQSSASVWMATSEIKRIPNPARPEAGARVRWSYDRGLSLESILDTWAVYGGDDLHDYLKMYVDTMIAPDGTIARYSLLDYNIDNVRSGHFIVKYQEHFPSDGVKAAILTMLRQLDEQPRSVADSVYWHKAIYAYQVWLDGIFMGLPFRAYAAPLYRSQVQTDSIWTDAAHQVERTYARTLDPKTGLCRHAYDETRMMFWADKVSGQSQHCWSRAQGWYMMALVELLDAIPASHPSHARIKALLQKIVDPTLDFRDKRSGVWHQVMDCPDRDGNYLESSSTAMFAYSLLKAADKGYLPKKYAKIGRKVYDSLVKNFIVIEPDGSISITDGCTVAGLGPGISPEIEKALRLVKSTAKAKENRRRDGSFEYYISEKVKDNDFKAFGPFIWASLVLESDGVNTAKIITRNARHRN